MEDLSAALLVGLVEGTVIGLLAAGLALRWRVRRSFDVALAEHAGLAALVLHLLGAGAGLPPVPAAVAAVTSSVLLALGVERLVLRRLPGRGVATAPVATAGVALGIIGVTGLVTGGGWVRAPAPAQDVLGALPGPVTPEHLLALGVLLGAGGGLWWLRRSTLGAVLAAAGCDAEAARLSGIDPARAAAVASGLAGLLAGLAGAVSAPLVDLAPGGYTLSALVPALAAAAVAGGSLPAAVGAGLLLGLLGRALAVVAPVALPAPAVVLGFVLLWAALLVAPRRLPVLDG